MTKFKGMALRKAPRWGRKDGKTERRKVEVGDQSTFRLSVLPSFRLSPSKNSSPLLQKRLRPLPEIRRPRERAEPRGLQREGLVE